MKITRSRSVAMALALTFAAACSNKVGDPADIATTVAQSATTEATAATSAVATTDEASTTTEPEAASTTTEPAEEDSGSTTPESTTPATSVADTTAASLPNVVEFEGSVQELIAQQPSLSNISEAIDAWLADSPGREGALLNSAGITLFLPNNDGFSEADIATATANFDAFTLFLSEHLKVGIVTSDALGTEVTTAMANSYPIGDGPTIGGQAIVEADIEGTNGVIHIIAAPLVPVAG